MKQTLDPTFNDDVDSDGAIDIDPELPHERIALYVYGGDFERRGLARDDTGSDPVYIANPDGSSETQFLVGGARIVQKDPGAGEGELHPDDRITVGITDLIQTTSAVIDLVSGALVETSTYYPNGARETYRAPDTENVAAEPYGLTGKEADEEVGLVYFGERYLIPRVGRWASPDPLSVHAAGGGEALNAFHYVSGNLLQGRDPLGLYDEAEVESVQRVESEERGVEHLINFTYVNEAGERLTGTLSSLYVRGVKFDENGHALDLTGAIVAWRDSTTGKIREDTLDGFINNNSFVAYKESMAAHGQHFGLKFGFFQDGDIDRRQSDFFWNRVSNAGDMAGASALILMFAPEPSMTKAAAGVLGLTAAVLSVASSARAALADPYEDRYRSDDDVCTNSLDETATGQQDNALAQFYLNVEGNRPGSSFAQAAQAGAASLALSQVQQMTVTVTQMQRLNNDQPNTSPEVDGL